MAPARPVFPLTGLAPRGYHPAVGASGPKWEKRQGAGRVQTFRGQSLRTIDTKGRLSLPSKYGKAPGQAYVVTRGLDDCLFVFLKDEWRRLEQKLSSLSLESRHARFYVRQMTSNAEDVSVDTHGRIMIPPMLRKLAGLEGEVLVIGALTRIELWNPETYEKYEKGFGLTFEEVAEALLEEPGDRPPEGEGRPKGRRG